MTLRLQLLLAFCVLFALPRMERLPNTLCTSTSRESEVRTKGGHTIAMEIRSPSMQKPKGIVLFVSGAGPHDRTYSTARGTRVFRDLTNRLVCAGYAVVGFDEVGTGKSTGSYDGYATTVTLASDVVDLVNAIRADRQTSPIYIIGHSEGGVIAAMVTASTEVAGVVLLAAPAHKGSDIIRDQSKTYRTRFNFRRQDLDSLHEWRSQHELWYQHFLTFDPATAYERLRVPALILQGERDWQVTPQQADSIQRILQRKGNHRVTVRKFANLGHDFVSEPDSLARIDTRATDEILCWLESNTWGCS